VCERAVSCSGRYGGEDVVRVSVWSEEQAQGIVSKIDRSFHPVVEISVNLPHLPKINWEGEDSYPYYTSEPY
jgi:hypothetical protein